MSELGQGLGAGVAATVALTALERIETRVLGRRPIYSAVRIAERWTGDDRWGALLRLGYGTAIGCIAAVALPRAGARFSARRAVQIALGIRAFELVFLPATGATPPMKEWPKRERRLLLLHILTFAFALEAVASRPGR